MVTVGELKEEFSGSEVALEIIENMLEEDENGAYWNSENYNDAGERIKDYNVTSDDIRGQVWDAQRELVRMEINDLMKWGHEDINSLVSQIENIRSIVENMEPAHTLDEFLDMSDLPTEEIPAGLETYPVWACDKAGRCLVGETADEVEDMDQILEWYAEKNPSHSITANGYESVEKTAKRNGNSAAVAVPASWLAHRVLCIRMD
jgi:putative transposon-encoded protein